MRALSISGFRKIQSDVGLDTPTLTVLIGKNGVGKSTVAKALWLTGHLARKGKLGVVQWDGGLVTELGLYNLNEVFSNANFENDRRVVLGWTCWDLRWEFELVERSSQLFIERYAVVLVRTNREVFSISAVSEPEKIPELDPFSKMRVDESGAKGWWSIVEDQDFLHVLKALLFEDDIESIDFESEQVVAKEGASEQKISDLTAAIQKLVRGESESRSSTRPAFDDSPHIRELLFEHVFNQVEYDGDRGVASLLIGWLDSTRNAPEVRYFQSRERSSQIQRIDPNSSLWNLLVSKRGVSQGAWRQESLFFFNELISGVLGIKDATIEIDNSPTGGLFVFVGGNFIHTYGSGQQQAILLALSLAAELESHGVKRGKAGDELNVIELEKERGKFSDEPRRFYVIEEPEANLHPDAQSKLIKVIVDYVAKMTGEIGLVIETHSEYLVRQLQLEVKEGKIHPSRVSLNYCDIQDSGSMGSRRIVLSENGSFVGEGFGRGFFDESGRLITSVHLS